MSTIATLNTKFTADTRDFDRALRGVEGAVSGVERSLRSVGASVTRAMSGAAVGLGVASGAAAAFIVSSGSAAMRVGELDVAMQAVAKSSGYSYDEMVKAVAGIRKTGIEYATAQQVALQFARANLNMADATKLARVAQDAAVIGQVNSTEALDRLLHGITTLNPIILRQLGILVDAETAYENYAKANNIASGRTGQFSQVLDGTQKQAAFLNEVMRQGALIAGTYEAAMTEPGKVLRSFARLVNDAQVAIGQGFTPALGETILPLYNFVKHITQALEPGQKLSPLVKALGDAITTLLKPLENVVKQLDAWFKALKPDDVDRIAKAFQDWFPVIVAVATALTTFAGKSLLTTVPLLGDLTRNLNPVTAGFIALVATDPQLRGMFVELVKNLAPLARSLLPAFRDILSQLVPIAEIVIRALTQIAYAVFPAIAKIMQAVVPIIGLVATAFGDVLESVASLVPVLLELFSTLVTTLTPIIAALLPTLTTLFDTLVDVLKNLLTALLPVVTVLGDAFLTVLKAVAPIIPQIAETLGRVVVVFVEGFAAVLPAIIPLVTVFAGLLEALAPIALWVANALVKIIEAIPAPVLGAMVTAWLAFKFATREARDAADGLASRMRPLGVSVAGVQVPVQLLFPLLLALAPVMGALAGVIVALHPLVSALAAAFAKLPAGVIVALTAAFVGMVGTFKILTQVTAGLEAVARTVNAPFDTWRETMGTVKSVSDTLGTALGILAARLGVKTGAVVADTAAETANAAATSGGIVATITAGVARAALAVKTGLVSVATGIWAAANTVVAATLWATVPPLLIVAAKILLIIAVVAALAVGIYFLIKHWDTVWGAIKTALEAVWNVFKTFINWFKDTFFGSWQKTVRTLLLVFVPFIGIPIQIVRNWSTIKQFFVDLFNAIKNAAKAAIDFIVENWRIFAVVLVTILTGPIGGIIALFFLMRDQFDAALNFMVGIAETAFNAIKGVFEGAVNFILDNWKWFALALVTILTGGLGAVFALFALFPDRVIGFFSDAANWLVQAGKDMISGLVSGITTAAEAVWAWLKALPGRILSFFVDAGKWLFKVGKEIIWGSGLLSGIIEGAKAMWDWFIALPGRILGFFATAGMWLFQKGWDILRGIFNGIVSGAEATWNFFSGLAGRILGIIGNAGAWLVQKGKDAITGMWNGIRDGAEAIWNWFRDLPNKIKNVVGDVGGWLLDMGKDIIKGLVNGIKSVGEDVGNTIKDVAKGAVNGVKSFFGIGSPSKLMMDIGEDLGLGLAIGIENTAGVVAAATGELIAAANVAVAGPTVGAPTVAGGAVSVAIPAIPDVPTPDTTGLVGAYEAAGDAADSWGVSVGDAADVQAAALGGAQSTLDSFSASQQSAWSNLSAQVRSIVTSLVSNLQTAWTSFAQQITATTQQLAQQVQTIVGNLASWLRNTWQTLANNMIRDWNFLRDTVERVTLEMMTRVRSIVDTYASSTRNRWQVFANDMVRDTNWMRDGIVNAMYQMRDGVTNASNQMLNNFRQVMNAMVEAGRWGGQNTGSGLHFNLNWFVNPIRDVTRNYAYQIREALNPILAGIGKDGIKLPFARGGTVPGAGDRDKVEALLTPGEFVIPKRAAKMLGKDTLEQLRRGWLPLTSQAPQGFQGGGQVQPQVRELANLVMSKVPGLQATSWFRPGGTSFHGKGQAVDIAGGIPAMRAAAAFLNNSGVWKSLAEGIFNPSGGGWPTWLSVYRGGQVPSSFWGGGTWGAHADHLHLAISGPIGEVSGDGLLVSGAISIEDPPDLGKWGTWVGYAVQESLKWIQKLAQEFVDQNTFQFEDFSDTGGAVAPEGQIKQWLTAAIQHVGGSMSWMNALYGRLMQESGGNPRAINLWDSNAKAGIPSKGLMQTIDPTFQAYRDKSLPNDVYHPIANIVAAINYMLARYGRIVGPSGTGYAAGGIVPATIGGRTITAGEGGRDEAVIPLPAGWQSMFSNRGESLSPAASTGREGPAITIEHYEVKENADHRRIFAMASFEQRAGRI